MKAIIEAHSKFLLSGKATLSSSVWTDTAEQHTVEAIRSISSLTAVNLIDSAAALDLLPSTVFNQDQQQRLAVAVNAKTTSAAASKLPVAGATCLQEHKYFHKYLTKDDWNVLTNQENSDSFKLQALVHRASCIGLSTPSEKTSTAIIAAMLLAKGTSEVEPAVALHLVQSFKSMMKKHRSIAGVKKTVDEFPIDPKSFMARYPDAYDEANPPVDAPFSDVAVLKMQVHVPCRVSHSSMRHQPHVASAASSSSSSNQQYASFMGMMQAMMQQFAGCPSPPPHQPPRRRKELALTWAGDAECGPVLEMLTDGAAVPRSEAAAASVPLVDAPEAAALAIIPRPEAAAAAVPRVDGNTPRVQAPPVPAMTAVDAIVGAVGGALSAKHRSAAMKRPAASEAADGEDTSAASEPAILGCSKCRYSAGGCGTCRAPGYKARPKGKAKSM
jgi:hypothetical protein